ncbi:hypothetical protein [Halobacterium bonnevillei]|uniref:Uncharacterized protein n=1 Tax=Halobacterium bonnevillei TaxID=2692200 RepID=A0A6B0SL45_9EURY|nr:hypothetical protein [Halobacterium bonnevillei]MXR19600.1 hypothetical protein [Halobacterium bonnevillei]
MIADSPLVDTLSTIEFTDTTYDDVALALQNAEYADGDAAGFATDTFQQDAISANLVVSSPTTVEAYDAGTGDVSEQEVDRTELVPFRIDFANDLLEVFASRADARSVQQHLGALDEIDATFGDYTIDVPSLHGALQASDLDATPTSVRIRNFSPMAHTDGDCFLRLDGDADVDGLLDEYGSNVYFLGTKLVHDGRDLTLGFYQSGAVQLYSKTDATEDLLDRLKDAI